MKVSFDFDGVFEYESIQDYARELIAKEVEVWIVTTRWDRTSKFCDPEYFKYNGNSSWQEVFYYAKEVGIPIKHIRFNNYQWKESFFKDNRDFIWHLDDNSKEINDIQKLGMVAIAYPSPNWKQKCERLLWTGTLEKKMGN